MDDLLMREQIVKGWLKQVYEEVYISGLVEMEKRREKEDQRMEMGLSNCWDELDVMMNGPREGRNKEIDIQVDEYELEEDPREKERVVKRVDQMYEDLKLKQK